MRLEPLRFAQRDRRRAERVERAGVALSSDVRFMKSRTPKPDEKRAERAVGRTWFEPPT